MITNFKIFEGKKIVLYKNDEFSININSNNYFTYDSNVVSSSGILYMMKLVSKNSKYLNDEELRNIELREKDIDDDIYYLYLNDAKINNIRTHKTGVLNYFFDKKRDDNKYEVNFIKPINGVYKMNIDLYMELTFMYNTKVINAIRKSKTLGDIIDNFKIIYNDFYEKLPMYVNMSTYNL